MSCDKRQPGCETLSPRTTNPPYSTGQPRNSFVARLLWFQGVPSPAYFRHGFRILARSPVFAITSLLILATGFSANVLVFGVAHAFLLRKLPVDKPERLVAVNRVHSSGFNSWHFVSDVCETLATTSKTFSAIACQGQLDIALRVDGGAERVRVHLVPPHFFSMLGVRAEIGRTFDSTGEHPEGMPAVLSHQFWQRRFRGDRSVLGRVVALNGIPFVVIGVSAAGFTGLDIDTSPDVRVLSSAGRQLTSPEAASGIPNQIFARLRPGQSIEAAEAEAEPLIQAAYGEYFERQYPGEGSSLVRNIRFHLQPITYGISALRIRFRNGLFALVAGVCFLLLMACANVAGLLFARTVTRASELSLRMALGASRWQIVHQMLAEGLPLAFLGGVLGILLAYAGLPLLINSIPPVRDRAGVLQPLAVVVGVNDQILLFAAGVGLLSALLFGLAPALIGLRVELMSTLQSGRTTTGRFSLQKFLVVAQVLTCTVLLLGAGLLTKTLDQMRSLDTGFDRDRVVTFTLDPSMLSYDADRAYSLAQELIRQTQALPMVSTASIARLGLMRGTGMKVTLAPAGEGIGQDEFLNCSINMITHNYFRTMGMRLVAGRDFSPSDEDETDPARVIVNQAFVEHFFPGLDPIGRRIGFGGKGGVAGADLQIVGVVTNSKYRSLREAIHPVVYSYVSKEDLQASFVLHVRTLQSQPDTVIGSVRDILRLLDPELPFIEVNMLEDEIETSLWQERLLAMLSSAFGTIAAVLAAIGLFGALDYAVRTRTREMGVRAALGARAQDIVRMLWLESLKLLSIGVTLGLCVHLALARWIRQVLYEVHPFDVTAVAHTMAIVVVVCIVATLPPHLRAMQIRPSEALHHE